MFPAAPIRRQAEFGRPPASPRFLAPSPGAVRQPASPSRRTPARAKRQPLIPWTLSSPLIGREAARRLLRSIRLDHSAASRPGHAGRARAGDAAGEAVQNGVLHAFNGAAPCPILATGWIWRRPILNLIAPATPAPTSVPAC